MLEIINPSMVSLIQSILIILSGLVILIASIGILTFDKDMPNIVGQYMFAVMYMVLAPFLAHAMANAYFYGEDDYNTLYAADMVEDKYAALNDTDKLEDVATEDVSGEDADSAEGNADETASENLDSGDESND